MAVAVPSTVMVTDFPRGARTAASEAVVFVHPWGCSLGARLATRYLGNTVGQPVETTVVLSHLISS